MGSGVGHSCAEAEQAEAELEADAPTAKLSMEREDCPRR